MPKKRAEVTEEEIARRAYEISQSDECGSDEENWWRAEQELSGPRAQSARPRRSAGEVASSATSKAKALATKKKGTTTKPSVS